MDIEEKKTDLEHERFLLTEERIRRESRFFNKHFGAIMTTAIAFATFLISGTEVWVAFINKDKELASIKLHKMAERNISITENKRRWRLDSAKFIFDKRDLIFSQDSIKSRQMRNVIIATFPEETTKKLFQKFVVSTSGDKQEIWIEGLDSIDKVGLVNDKSRKGNLENRQTSSSQKKKSISSDYIVKLVEKFRGEERRNVSNRISELYKNNPKPVIEGLVRSIITDEKGSYRVNLYIARTLENIQPFWKGNETQINNIRLLRESPNYKDETFKMRVDNALLNYKKIE